MSKVTFFSFPCCGHMYPALGLMRALVQRGEVLTIVSSEEFKDSIEAIGALYRDYGPEMDILQKNIYGQSGKITYLSYQLLVMSEKVIPRYLKSMKEQSPDYIIFDSMCVWGRFLAEIMNITLICSISMFAILEDIKIYLHENVQKFFITHL